MFLGGFTRGLPLGRTQVGDRHLNFHEDRDTLGGPVKRKRIADLETLPPELPRPGERVKRKRIADLDIPERFDRRRPDQES
jgi:hypothetical protein